MRRFVLRTFLRHRTLKTRMCASGLKYRIGVTGRVLEILDFLERNICTVIPNTFTDTSSTCCRTLFLSGAVDLRIWHFSLATYPATSYEFKTVFFLRSPTKNRSPIIRTTLGIPSLAFSLDFVSPFSAVPLMAPIYWSLVSISFRVSTPLKTILCFLFPPTTPLTDIIGYSTKCYVVLIQTSSCSC